MSGINSAPQYSEDDIRENGLKDAEYTEARKMIQEGCGQQVQGEYGHVAQELMAHDMVLLRDGKFVIPKGDGVMRRHLLETAHEGHPGVSQIKTILRGTVFWPGITRDVEEMFKCCLACQATKEGIHHRDKLVPNEPPERVWSTLGGDHWGPLPDGSGRYILVVQDYLTKYPEAIPVRSTAAKDNIPVLEEIFGRHGYP